MEHSAIRGEIATVLGALLGWISPDSAALHPGYSLICSMVSGIFGYIYWWVDIVSAIFCIFLARAIDWFSK